MRNTCTFQLFKKDPSWLDEIKASFNGYNLVEMWTTKESWSQVHTQKATKHGNHLKKFP